jgi:WXG100 family type VII secretion target
MGARMSGREGYPGLWKIGGSPMAHGYQLDHQAMSAGARALDDTSVTINGHIAKLESEMSQLFQGWQGQAAQSFDGLHQSWTEQQKLLVRTLQEMHQTLLKTMGEYASQETVHTDQYKKIRNSI